MPAKSSGSNARSKRNAIGTSLTINSRSDLKFTSSSSDVKSAIMAHGIYDRYDMDWHKKFTRFGIIDPNNTITTTKEYIFITKPDLCLFNYNGSAISPILSNNIFFRDAIERYTNVAKQLQSSVSIGDGPFINILSNSVTSSLDIPGITADEVDTGSNIMGTKVTYRGTSYKSDIDHSFNLEFEDTKYLDVYMLFKMYDEYEKLKWNGALDFTNCDSDRWNNYIINRVLHDQMTIYKFVVAEDGYRIIYWARITGCYPNSIPREAFGDMTSGGPQKLTVGWKGHFVRDMDPVVIYQFNQIVSDILSKAKEDLPLFNTSTHTMEGEWATIPYIDIRNVPTSSHGNRKEYYLRWRK